MKLLRPLLFALGSSLALGLAGCASSKEHHYLHHTEQSAPAHWSYAGETGPEHWGDLSPDYALAKTGRMQSPIDIGATAAGDEPALAFDYGSESIQLVYNGHTVQEGSSKTSSISLGGTEYVLQQLHFHSPSEHTVGGRSFPMEMHLVHQSADGHIAVVGVLIREGAENPAFAPLWANLPDEANRERKAATRVELAKLLPAERASYRYEGSFTTPPCTEGVKWILLRAPTELSKGQIEAFRAVIHGNNRPVQPLNGRVIRNAP